MTSVCRLTPLCPSLQTWRPKPPQQWQPELPACRAGCGLHMCRGSSAPETTWARECEENRFGGGGGGVAVNRVSVESF